MSKTVVIDCSRITDRTSFHDEFSAAFGFPEFYGRNRDAWFDCMSSLDESFSAVRVERGDAVILCLDKADQLKARAPDILWEIFEATALVNHRRIQDGDNPILFVSCSL